MIDRALRPGPGSGRASNVRPKPGSGRTSQKPGPGPGLLDFKFSRCFFEMCTRHARRAEQPIASVQYFKREANSSTFFSGFALPKKSKQNKKNIGKTLKFAIFPHFDEICLLKEVQFGIFSPKMATQLFVTCARLQFQEGLVPKRP